MICGKTLKIKINNETIRQITGVERLEEFLKEQRLQWLRYVERKDEERIPVKTLHLQVEGTKKTKTETAMERSSEMWHDCQRFAKVGWTRSWKMATRLQKPRTSAWLREQKEARSWGKMMMKLNVQRHWLYSSPFRCGGVCVSELMDQKLIASQNLKGKQQPSNFNPHSAVKTLQNSALNHPNGVILTVLHNKLNQQV